jgi:hypothetical protein
MINGQITIWHIHEANIKGKSVHINGWNEFHHASRSLKEIVPYSLKPGLALKMDFLHSLCCILWQLLIAASTHYTMLFQWCLLPLVQTVHIHHLSYSLLYLLIDVPALCFSRISQMWNAKGYYLMPHVIGLPQLVIENVMTLTIYQFPCHMFVFHAFPLRSIYLAVVKHFICHWWIMQCMTPHIHS